jgi:hypothetical protein
MYILWISDPQEEGCTMGTYLKYVLEGRGPQRGVMDLESKPGGGVDERDSPARHVSSSELLVAYVTQYAIGRF